jgi:hypothetical protein
LHKYLISKAASSFLPHWEQMTETAMAEALSMAGITRSFVLKSFAARSMMADHEKLTEEMNEIFNRILSAADDLTRWDVPAAKREKIISLARKLRETAYQAGRTEMPSDRED